MPFGDSYWQQITLLRCLMFRFGVHKILAKKRADFVATKRCVKSDSMPRQERCCPHLVPKLHTNPIFQFSCLTITGRLLNQQWSGHQSGYLRISETTMRLLYV